MKRITLLALAAASALAIASPARAVDFTQQLTEIDGKPVVDKDGKPVDAQLGKFARDALLAVFPDEQNLDPAKKFERWRIVLKIVDKDGKFLKDPLLTPEELAIIKTVVGKAYPTSIVGQAWEMLDPNLKVAR